ncbi:Gluconeogenesis factor [Fundidesulfovibrio magnetotacticus]|uniref:Gluconeogenesis factor n=1 Tax=Fundidesulfovibrio magnetotacticus TaxID=2730080 RepID=A0A6V8M5B0_9BACT|nr:GAK system CofD-like protein [Fundidesulfovibrio magnetotacticus]GFK95725.1 Gluconeogenesis factor [Fundidesulfovibrio magnetotacticus]
MTKVTVTHTVRLPDPVKIARYLKAPELGPRVLFFSGGTALRDLSRELVRYTHNSMHLITPFDSGGSSAKLRKSFGMLAVGDLRNRLMALADRTLHGNPEIYALFARRLPKDQPQEALREELEGLIAGRDPLVAAVPDPMRKIIRTHLKFFAQAMERTPFDLRGASVGNLILAGGFFNYNRQIDPVIYMFSMLVKARGLVRPIINRDLTLCAELDDGSVLAGQHLLTGKESGPVGRKVRRVWLSRGQEDTAPVEIDVRRKVKENILSAELICYPIGSFYSSVVANLLPRGVGDAVSKAQCPKVFVPNPAGDPEQYGLGLGESVRALLEYLRASCTKPRPANTLLNHVLIDRRRNYQEPHGLRQIEAMGIGVIEADLESAARAPYFDEQAVIENLLSLA